MSGVCLKEVTAKFPMFPLQRRVLDDLKSGHKQSGGNLNDFSKIAKFVGGETGFMVGIKYFPQPIFQLHPV